MVRLRNAQTGAVVNVSEETAVRLGAPWREADASELSETPDSTWKVADLRAYADENGIDLGEATKKADILDVLAGAGAEGSGGEGDES